MRDQRLVPRGRNQHPGYLVRFEGAAKAIEIAIEQSARRAESPPSVHEFPPAHPAAKSRGPADCVLRSANGWEHEDTSRDARDKVRFRPKSSPVRTKVRRTTLLRCPPGSFLLSTNQSPSEERSLSRRPNHPSSKTNNSIPKSAAAPAILSSLGASKSKYVASQLLTRIGRGLSRHSPLQRRLW
jgi:hypothetical protein